MENRLKFYNKATQKLALQAMKYNTKGFNGFSLPEMVFLLRDSFKYKLTYNKVFGELCPNYGCDPSTSFCIVASYCIYERTGGAKIWTFKQTPVHCWLEHKKFKEPFDITYTQFTHAFPYKLGKEEKRLKEDPIFVKVLQDRAHILGQCAGIE